MHKLKLKKKKKKRCTGFFQFERLFPELMTKDHLATAVVLNFAEWKKVCSKTQNVHLSVAYGIIRYNTTQDKYIATTPRSRGSKIDPITKSIKPSNHTVSDYKKTDLRLYCVWPSHEMNVITIHVPMKFCVVDFLYLWIRQKSKIS